jgi:hypothetical protein
MPGCQMTGRPAPDGRPRYCAGTVRTVRGEKVQVQARAEGGRGVRGGGGAAPVDQGVSTR